VLVADDSGLSANVGEGLRLSVSQWSVPLLFLFPATSIVGDIAIVGENAYAFSGSQRMLQRVFLLTLELCCSGSRDQKNVFGPSQSP
jgi:hypothetical protein